MTCQAICGSRCEWCTSARSAIVRRAVATRKDLDFSYTLTDRIVGSASESSQTSAERSTTGTSPCSLEQAQLRKYEYVDEQIGIGSGRRVLDLGCGWGPLLEFIRGRGGTGVGVTLSSAHVAACRRHGLDAHLYDARRSLARRFGAFDAVTMLGASSSTSARRTTISRGRQEEVYRGPVRTARRACCPTRGASTCRPRSTGAT